MIKKKNCSETTFDVNIVTRSCQWEQRISERTRSHSRSWTSRSLSVFRLVIFPLAYGNPNSCCDRFLLDFLDFSMDELLLVDTVLAVPFQRMA